MSAPRPPWPPRPSTAPCRACTSMSTGDACRRPGTAKPRKLLCTHVRAETHDVKSFFFRSPAGHAFAFMPGQFLTLELEIGGARLNRCYTISSPPTQPHTLSITVKRVPGGPVSNWLHDHLSAGMTVRTLGPAGVFSNALHPAERYLFLSAGSGITPLMSMARTHRDLCDDRDIVRPQRPHARRHHLRARTGPAGLEPVAFPRPLRLRAARPPTILARADRPAEPARAGAHGARFPRSHRVHLRTGPTCARRARCWPRPAWT